MGFRRVEEVQSSGTKGQGFGGFGSVSFERRWDLEGRGSLLGGLSYRALCYAGCASNGLWSYTGYTSMISRPMSGLGMSYGLAAFVLSEQRCYDVMCGALGDGKSPGSR